MNKKTISIESLFVMVLFMVFAISIVMMILSGKTGYEKILNEKESSESLRTTGSYFRMKVKQSDQRALTVLQDDALQILEISQDGIDSEYRTAIFYQDGRIWESYFSKLDGFDAELAEPVIDIAADSIGFSLNKKGLEIVYVLEGREVRQFVSLKLEEAKR